MPSGTRLTEHDVRSFLDNGYLVVRRLVGAEELRVLAQSTAWLVEAAREGRDDPDYYYDTHPETGHRTPFRVEYVVDKLGPCRALLGHPGLLGAIESLQGHDFLPTWDSLVFKLAGAGIGHPWHRDAAPYDPARVDTGAAAIDVGVYLDGSDLGNCLWVLPGSHNWGAEQAQAEIDRRNAGGFDSAGATPVPVEPGDAFLHNIMTLHGSPPTRAGQCRVIYYEFRQIAIESAFGPHRPECIPLKQHVLHTCLHER
jgi:hypothetical protein